MRDCIGQPGRETGTAIVPHLSQPAGIDTSPVAGTIKPNTVTSGRTDAQRLGPMRGQISAGPLLCGAYGRSPQLGH